MCINFIREEPTENSEILTAEIPVNVKAKRYFANLLKQNITLLSAETNIMTTLDPDSRGNH